MFGIGVSIDTEELDVADKLHEAVDGPDELDDSDGSISALMASNASNIRILFSLAIAISSDFRF